MCFLGRPQSSLRLRSGQALPRKSSTVRFYSRATEDLSYNPVMPVMEASASAFYSWSKKPEDTDKNRQREALEAKASEIFIDHKQTYGYRRLSNELGKVGIKSGHHQVRHLMARLGLKARYPKRFKVTTDNSHNGAIPPNSLDRHFDVVAPNQVWTTDITYILTLEGWLYLAVVIDLFSRQVAGWAVALTT